MLQLQLVDSITCFFRVLLCFEKVSKKGRQRAAGVGTTTGSSLAGRTGPMRTASAVTRPSTCGSTQLTRLRAPTGSSRPSRGADQTRWCGRTMQKPCSKCLSNLQEYCHYHLGVFEHRNNTTSRRPLYPMNPLNLLLMRIHFTNTPETLIVLSKRPFSLSHHHWSAPDLKGRWKIVRLNGHSNWKIFRTNKQTLSLGFNLGI